jgi:transaldolase
MNFTDSTIKTKIFADGADKSAMIEMYNKSYIKGLTTNPTLMKKAGIKDYEAFSKDILQTITDKPLSLEVFSDDLDEMERQALKISRWANNVYVKIPITNSKGIPTYSLIKKLANNGVKVNVTAIMTLSQVRDVVLNLSNDVESYVSVFAGRIADTGIDPVPLMSAAVQITSMNSKAEVIWASPRELLNVFQADQIGCQVITVTNDILKKLELYHYDLNEYSLDTVKMFYNDALSAGYSL